MKKLTLEAIGGFLDHADAHDAAQFYNVIAALSPAFVPTEIEADDGLMILHALPSVQVRLCYTWASHSNSFSPIAITYNNGGRRWAARFSINTPLHVIKAAALAALEPK